MRLLRLAPALWLLAAAPADPPWAAGVVGHFEGWVRNAGKRECHRTDLYLKDGRLLGHYAIADDEPFEGELTEFQPEGDDSGTFTWTDRYGVGVEFLKFSPDGARFAGFWGVEQPSLANTITGLRDGHCGSDLESALHGGALG